MKGYLGCLLHGRFHLCNNQGFVDEFRRIKTYNIRTCELEYNSKACRNIHKKILGYELHG